MITGAPWGQIDHCVTNDGIVTAAVPTGDSQ